MRKLTRIYPGFNPDVSGLEFCPPRQRYIIIFHPECIRVDYNPGCQGESSPGFIWVSTRMHQGRNFVMRKLTWLYPGLKPDLAGLECGYCCYQCLWLLRLQVLHFELEYKTAMPPSHMVFTSPHVRVDHCLHRAQCLAV